MLRIGGLEVVPARDGPLPYDSLIPKSADEPSSATAADAETRALAAAKAGNRSAMEALLRRHYDQAYAFSRALLGDEEEATDVTREVMIAIARGIGSFDRRSELSTWMWRMTAETAWDESRRRRQPTFQARPAAETDLRGISAGGQVGSGETAGSYRTQPALEEALGQVAEEERTAAVLRDMLHLEYQVIADVLLVPIATVRSRVARGRAGMVQMLPAGGSPASQAPPPGARDRAVLAALFVSSLSLAAETARETTSAPQLGPTTASHLGLTSVPAGLARRPPAGSSGGDSRILPPSSRDAARWRRGPRVAVAGLVLLAIGSGVAASLAPEHRAPVSIARPRPTAAPARPVRRAHPTTAAKSGRSPSPALGVVALQLRPQLGLASCAKAARRLESVGGVFVVLNPPPGRFAVVALPAGSGPATTCVSLGPAIATVWSGNIVHLSVHAIPVTGTALSSVTSKVDVVIRLSPSAHAGVSRLRAAERHAEAIEVVAQGADLGTAVVAKGRVITLSVGPSLAKFLERQLRHHVPARRS